MPVAKKPEARVVSEVCSMCGLDWARHGAKPTTETCIRLLASDLAAANERANRVPYSYPVPYPVYPRPFMSYPLVWSAAIGSANPPVYNICSSPGNINSASCSSSMPQLSSSVPHAVAA